MGLPEAVTDEIANLESKIEKVRNLAFPHAAACKAAKAAGFEGTPGVEADSGTPYVDVHAYGHTFKQVGTFGKALRRHGFRLKGQFDMGTVKVIYYTGPITLFMSFGSGATCRYVQVGEKMQPVYELRCGEQA